MKESIHLAYLEKQINLYELDRQIERKFLPEALSNNRFLSIDCLINLICSFNEILTSGRYGTNDTPGKFRTGPVILTNSDHRPSPASDIGSLMQELARYVIQNWNGDVVKLHAFVPWRINSIHPFFDGNGRTARAFSYFLLCVKFGKLLPGRKTIITQIQENKSDHYRALRDADNGNIATLENQTRTYLREQLESALESEA